MNQIYHLVGQEKILDDFGQGFYLTTDIGQARRFVKSSIGKAVKNGVIVEDKPKGFVSTYCM